MTAGYGRLIRRASSDSIATAARRPRMVAIISMCCGGGSEELLNQFQRSQRLAPFEIKIGNVEPLVQLF